MKKRKPTRRDLLIVVGRLQGLAGAASARNNDRNQNRHADVHGVLQEMLDLCIEARSYEPPLEDSGPWAGSGEPKRYT